MPRRAGVPGASQVPAHGDRMPSRLPDGDEW